MQLQPSFVVMSTCNHFWHNTKSTWMRMKQTDQKMAQIHFKLYNPRADDFLSDCFGWMERVSEWVCKSKNWFARCNLCGDVRINRSTIHASVRSTYWALEDEVGAVERTDAMSKEKRLLNQEGWLKFNSIRLFTPFSSHKTTRYDHYSFVNTSIAKWLCNNLLHGSTITSCLCASTMLNDCFSIV